jgi:CBS domain-containing protein
MKLGELMTKDVVAVSPETPLREVAELLARHRISGVPVVDEERRVVGVVSEADIVRKEAGEELRSGLLAWILSEKHPGRLEARTAGEAMTSPPLTAPPERDVAEAARLMTQRQVNRLPVVDPLGQLIGIVTRADLVRAFIRSDEEILRELRDDVVLGVLWIDPARIEISAKDGEVTLAGEVDTKADAVLLERFAARVPGVVAVRSQLRWRVDEPRLPRSDPRVPQPPPR